MAQTRSGDFRLYRRLLEQSRPYWPHLAALLLLGLLSTPLALLAPVPLKIVVDSVIGDHAMPPLLRALAPEGSRAGAMAIAVGLLLGVALLVQLQELVVSLLRTWAGERLVLAFRSQLFRHVQRLSLSYADSAGSADSTYRIQYDAPAIQSIAMEGIMPLITSSVTVVAMIAVSASVDWQIAAVALAVSPMLLAVTWHYRGRLRQRWREVKRLQSDAHSHVSEVLSAIRVVKAFGQEDREHHRFLERSNRSVAARMGTDLVEGVFGILVGLVIAGGTAAALLLGASHVRSGALTLGDLLLVMGYLAQLYGPLKTISRKAGRIQSQLASAERAFTLLDQAPEVQERPRARPLRRAAGAVSFRNVTFGYGGGPPVLRDVCLDVPAGATVGIAGRTGAGKTTLLSLLPRFYDPTEGSILLDGVDLRDWRLADLRRQFAIVLQEPVLFSTSISENIAYARPGAGPEDVAAAAVAAGADEFIRALPDGYETRVGERGMRLSGGERQRIAIARAFLTDAPILILDEPTSALDVKTETAILDALRRLMQGRTTFLIAHRPGTLDLCDLRVRVEGSRLVELPGGAPAGHGGPAGIRQPGAVP